MPPPLVLPLHDSTDPRLVGGKAFGLSRLLAGGYPVPNGICVTTEAYRRYVREQGIDTDERWRAVTRAADAERRAVLDECRSLILRLDLSALATLCRKEMAALGAPPGGRWAVRSSATQEDRNDASFAGLYRTRLGVPQEDLEQALKELWASVWEERVVRYWVKTARESERPVMAIVIQPLLDAAVAGVGYSVHPLTGRTHQVFLNAVPGLGAPLVDGLVTPEQYVIETDHDGQPITIKSRIIADKAERLIVGIDGLRVQAIPEADRARPALSDEQAFALARCIKQVERSFGSPVDVEWAIDQRHPWLLQARPIAGVRRSGDLTDEECEWSRANFKETLPEVPSPLGLSFVEYFMETYIVGRYRRLGCRIPEGLSAVRTWHGRPYLNVSLFHSLVGQLGGDPTLNVEQMGGERLQSEPPFRKLQGPALIRAGWLMWRELRKVVRQGPRWFAEMKHWSTRYHPDRVRCYSFEEVNRHLDDLGRWLDRREVTFGIAAGVGQCLQAFSSLLPRWLGDDWRTLLNQALQGQGTVISAQQIVRLAELASIARHDGPVFEALGKGWDLAALRRGFPSSVFLLAFDRYLDDYGHRGTGESDIMSPRFADRPDAVLDIIRTQLQGPASDPSDILARQRSRREAALATIRRRFGRRWDRWLVFRWWHRRLSRFFSLREANRHHLMYYSMAIRHLLLRFGDCLVERGTFLSADDVFFITLDERAALSSDRSGDWVALIRKRRQERARCLATQVPDTIRDDNETGIASSEAETVGEDGRLRGIAISAGAATGRARLVRSAADWNRVRPGDIIVAPVLDPGMAPLFGIAAGIVVEMGGTLSHGAIIAREYGLPAVANVPRVMSLLNDEELITVDGGSGEVTKASASGS
jgi:pyruvate,water dikinase